MLLILEIIGALIVLGALTVYVYIVLQGDAVMELQTEGRTPAVKVSERGGRLDFEITLPVKNSGRQEGTILDAYLRIYLPQEQYADVLLRVRVNLEGALRGDDYFEALLVPAGTGRNLVLRFEAYARNGRSTVEALAGAPDVDVALFADCRGRRGLYTVKKIFTLTAGELRALTAEENFRKKP